MIIIDLKTIDCDFRRLKLEEGDETGTAFASVSNQINKTL